MSEKPFSIRRIDLCNKKVQFSIGFLAGILYFIVLLVSSHTSFANLQLPEGSYANNQWKCTDVISYYQPAKNFLENGIFGYGTHPDSARPIGYQLFLALLMAIFGSRWIYAAFIIQSFLLALIYPVTTAIIEEVAHPEPKHIKLTFLVSLLSGIYFTRSVYIGPDALLVLLLISGIYFTIISVKYKKWRYAIMSLIIIGYGAQVRPTLILYPIINVLIIIWAGLKFQTLRARFTKLFLIFSTFFFLIVCNLPSLRNYINHRVFTSSALLSANYYDYLAKKILIKKDLSDYFYKTKAEIESKADINIQLSGKKEKALEVIKNYPFTALKVVFVDNLKSVMLDNHLVNFTANFYGYNWKPFKAADGCYSLSGSRLLYLLCIVIAFLYCILYLFFFYSMYQLWRKKKFMLCITILIIIFMFLAPSIIIGDGGARFRIPFEWLIVVIACRTNLSFQLK